jgi:uncharacterized protein (DUF362 family)/Pyruvate/2-oxoacid:ferredoxin oxidoreductase delta subunit
MSKVIVCRSTYDYSDLRPRIFSLLDSLEGGRIRGSSRVLIKPNFLTAAKPEEAVLTHPAVIRAAVEYVLAKGARPLVADSPAVGSFKKILRDNGVMEALQGLEVECRPLTDSVAFDIGPPFGKIEMARDVFAADFIISLPKLKTHSSMLLTLGVKNSFGCIVGLRKPQWHFRTGVEVERFAELIVLIHKAVNPFITILDGILAMEGDGPGRSGKPRPVGVLMGSNDAFCLDMAVCRMLGVQPAELSTCRAAQRLGYITGDPVVEGPLPLVNNFQLPGMSPLVFGPKPLQGLIRKYLVRRPVVNPPQCTMCGECWKFCPAQAISGEGKTLGFDYEKCIRCYCCLEVCPQGALSSAGSPAARLWDSYLKRRGRTKPGGTP